MKTLAIILAAKQGNNMKSYVNKQAKSSFLIFDKPMINYVIDALKENVNKIVSVIGFDKDNMLDLINNQSEYVIQEKTEGTLNAINLCVDFFDNYDNILVIYGCMPLINKDCIKELLNQHQSNNNDVTFTNGLYVFKTSVLKTYLKLLNEGEIKSLLTMIENDGKHIEMFNLCEEECLIVKNRIDLAKAYKFIQNKINTFHMLNGVTIIDSESTYIGNNVKIGNDSIIYPNTYILGKSIIGVGSELGPNTYIIDSFIDNGAVLKNCSIINKNIANKK